MGKLRAAVQIHRMTPRTGQSGLSQWQMSVLMSDHLSSFLPWHIQSHVGASPVPDPSAALRRGPGLLLSKVSEEMVALLGRRRAGREGEEERGGWCGGRKGGKGRRDKELGEVLLPALLRRRRDCAHGNTDAPARERELYATRG